MPGGTLKQASLPIPLRSWWGWGEISCRLSKMAKADQDGIVGHLFLGGTCICQMGIRLKMCTRHMLPWCCILPTFFPFHLHFWWGVFFRFTQDQMWNTLLRKALTNTWLITRQTHPYWESQWTSRISGGEPRDILWMKMWHRLSHHSVTQWRLMFHYLQHSTLFWGLQKRLLGGKQSPAALMSRYQF